MSTTIFLSGELQGDIYDDCSAAENEMEDALSPVIANREYGLLNRWSLIVIILPGEHPDYPEVKRYHKRTHVFEFRLKLDHPTFKAADDLGKRKLIMAALLRSIDEMRKLVPKGIDYARLETDVRGVAASKGWL